MAANGRRWLGSADRRGPMRRSLLAFTMAGLTAACGLSDSTTYAFSPKQTAGSGVAWVVIVRRTHPAFSIDSASFREHVLGTFVIDAKTLRPEFRAGLDLGSGIDVVDGRGNQIWAGYSGGTFEAGDYAERVLLREPGGTTRPLGEPEPGGLQCLSVAVAGEEASLFFIRDQYGRSGSPQVGCIDLEKNTVTRLSMPPTDRISADDWVWDYLFACNLDEFVLVGRCYQAGRWSHLTWSGNMRTSEWRAPVPGAFQPLDAKGGLVEIRDRTDRPAALAPTEIEWIEGGRRRVADIGFSGGTVPVFGTHYLAWWDAAADELVLRSLNDEQEFRYAR